MNNQKNIRKNKTTLSPSENSTYYNLHSASSLTERNRLNTNPKVLLKTFDKNLLDQYYSTIDPKNIDYNNINFGSKIRFIGVDEGLITLPSNFRNYQLRNQRLKFNLIKPKISYL